MQRPLRHQATSGFWAAYNQLPAEIRHLADQCFELLKQNPRHPSLHFKKVGRYRSVRVGLYYRAVGLDTKEGVAWFWIGSHSEYDKLVS
jgi:hypothetical protein